MSHETAKELYRSSEAAGQQFEYFLTGAIGAAFAYIAQNYAPQKLGITPSLLEPVALLCLAGAFYCGLKRIECLYHSLGINYEKHQALGDAEVTEAAVKKILTEPEKCSPRHGLTLEEIKNHAGKYRSRAQSADPILALLQSKVVRFYTWRNRLMVAGVSLFFLAKVLSPYF